MPSALIVGSPKAKAYPVAYHAKHPKHASNRFNRMMFFAFLARTLPAESIAKPAYREEVIERVSYLSIEMEL